MAFNPMLLAGSVTIDLEPNIYSERQQPQIAAFVHYYSPTPILLLVDNPLALFCLPFSVSSYYF